MENHRVIGAHDAKKDCLGITIASSSKNSSIVVLRWRSNDLERAPARNGIKDVTLIDLARFVYYTNMFGGPKEVSSATLKMAEY